MGGITSATDISGSLDAKNIVLGVLEKQLAISDFVKLAVAVGVPELTATIPVQTVPDGDEDLKEWEGSVVAGSDFTHVDFDLKKDRVKIGKSDESGYKSRAGDPLALQKSSSASRLAYILDKKFVAAVQTSPQTGAVVAVWNTGHPLADIGKAVATLKPFKADFVIMSANVWAIYAGNADITGSGNQGPGEKSGALTKVPGFNLDIYVSDLITAKTVIVGASGAPAVAYGYGPTKVRQQDVMDGGEIYQIDVFRQMKAPILKTSGSLNMAAYVLTGVIT